MEELNRSRRNSSIRIRSENTRSGGRGGITIRRRESPPSKRTKCSDANLINNYDYDYYYSDLGTTQSCCELQPLIETLMNSDPCDMAHAMGILQQMQSRLEMDNINDDDENYIDRAVCSTTTIHNESLVSLPRILMVRLGYFQQQQPSIPTPLATTFYILVLKCWKACLDRRRRSSSATRRSSSMECDDPDMTTMGLRIIFALLERVVEGGGTTTTSGTASGNEITTGWTTETGTMVGHCIDLLETWLESKKDHGAPSTEWVVMMDRQPHQTLLEDVAIALIQIAHMASASSNDEQSSSDVASTILAFFDMHQHQQQQQQHVPWSTFGIARRILCNDRMIGGDESLSVEDRLFWMRCRGVVSSQTRRPHAGIVSPEQPDQGLHYIFSILQCKQSTVESKERAARALITNLHQLTLERIYESIQIALVLQNTRNDRDDGFVFTMLMLQGLVSLEKLLLQSTNLPHSWETILDLVMTVALDGAFGDYKVANQAGMVGIVILSLGIRYDSLPPPPAQSKKRMFHAIQRLMESSIRPVVARLQALICEWIDHSSTRKEILCLCPEVLVSLARLISSHRVPSSEILATLHAISTMLETEPTNNFLAREPAVVEAVVTMTVFQNPDSSEASMMTAQEIRKEALMILLCLSENPCNRRILAKHPGLLSSMIHVARHLPPDPIESHSIEPGPHAGGRFTDMKRHILLLAHAL